MTELLCAVALLGLAAVLAGPVIGDWRQKKELDMAAAEAAATIRLVQLQARNESESLSSMSRGLHLIFTRENGQGRYYVKKGTRVLPPRKAFPESISMDPSYADLYFRNPKTGLVLSQNNHLYLKTKDGKYKREIIVEAYTGRVRISDGYE